MRKPLIRTVVGAASGVGLGVLFRPGSPGRRMARQAGDRLVRRARWWSGAWSGARYRLSGRRPDPDVADNVLADRIRSALGPVAARLDLPHVHVMVEDHTAVLHGDVGSARDAAAIERAVAEVSGVVGVESHLHIGLIASDTRPSQGAAVRPADSSAFARLVRAAERAGVERHHARRAVITILGAFSERLPDDERRQLLSHLPEDVRRLATLPSRPGAIPRSIRTVDELAARVASTDGVSPAEAEHVIASVLGCLKILVPEEVVDIGAVLPDELRRFWTNATPAI